MSALDKDMVEHARALIGLCLSRSLTLTTAESCTGGLLAASLTAVPGSSAVFDRGVVTYSNEAKMQLLGVEAEMLESVGAVSEDVAVAMALGALAAGGADLGVAITGIAGPDGATEGKPVGLVHLAAARIDGLVRPKRYVFAGTRDDVRLASVHAAIDLLEELIVLREDDDPDAPDTPDAPTPESL
ncbi:CinA family protein [Roseospira marina]|uniref:CinA family protein n=1 Tax=Roseospira marina TaxID=140057 RepID=A0A5M6IHQ3_9PROT|nr:CinA family protein [Roseospira marina]KAA5607108.1 CinA family protein [Roseospira marina]MBB4312696.1 nicotinamide-nucleotide amidase [Roseospira marina]MBB5086531.1 nicotinamide-nucleotide amidase [Roseospira marina]